MAQLPCIGFSWPLTKPSNFSTWMSQEFRKWLGSARYNPLIYPILISRWNNPLILTIDPNFRPGTSKYGVKKGVPLEKVDFSGGWPCRLGKENVSTVIVSRICFRFQHWRDGPWQRVQECSGHKWNLNMKHEHGNFELFEPEMPPWNRNSF